MSDHEHWQLDGSAPELYQRYLVPAITSLWAADLIERALPCDGEAVLDVACGTGAVTRLAAERMTHGRVTGLDFNAGMLGVARTVPATGVPIEWREGSALDLPFEDASFDVVLCQLGLQFFPDQRRALREMRRVLAPSGRIALSVYTAIERTPVAHAFVRALDRTLGPESSKTKRAEHVAQTEADLAALIAGEGFEAVDVVTVRQRISFPSALDYVRFQLTATPMAALIAGRTDRDAVIAAIAADTAAFLDPAMLKDGRLTSPQESLVATARRGPA